MATWSVRCCDVAMDQTENHLLRLTPSVQRRASEMVATLRMYGIPARIISSVRTPAEQRRLVEAGASRTLASLHLQGRAFDIWFGNLTGRQMDALPVEFWNAIGSYGESLGLRWGGRWRFRDLVHFEL